MQFPHGAGARKLPTVSIVDDDIWAREGIRELVESLGFGARAFENAEQFLESGILGETACLITDLQMPGLSGLDLQKELRVQGYRIPVIFITAFPDERHRSSAFGAGAIGFLRKPFDERSLIDCLALAFKPPHDTLA
jgi:FixJ family two-component response regulator